MCVNEGFGAASIPFLAGSLPQRIGKWLLPSSPGQSSWILWSRGASTWISAALGFPRGAAAQISTLGLRFEEISHPWAAGRDGTVGQPALELFTLQLEIPWEFSGLST